MRIVLEAQPAVPDDERFQSSAVGFDYSQNFGVQGPGLSRITIIPSKQARRKMFVIIDNGDSVEPCYRQRSQFATDGWELLQSQLIHLVHRSRKKQFDLKF